MTTFDDLSAWDYYEILEEPHCFKAIGWLDHCSQFETGQSSPAFFQKICELVVASPAFVRKLGYHDCELCQFDKQLGTGEVFVPGDNVIYVAPKLITHYIAAHWYSPPREFVAAVTECPDGGSGEYRKAFLDSGGHDLIRALKARHQSSTQ